MKKQFRKTIALAMGSEEIVVGKLLFGLFGGSFFGFVEVENVGNVHIDFNGEGKLFIPRDFEGIPEIRKVEGDISDVPRGTELVLSKPCERGEEGKLHSDRWVRKEEVDRFRHELVSNRIFRIQTRRILGKNNFGLPSFHVNHGPWETRLVCSLDFLINRVHWRKFRGEFENSDGDKFEVRFENFVGGEWVECPDPRQPLKPNQKPFTEKAQTPKVKLKGQKSNSVEAKRLGLGPIESPPKDSFHGEGI